MIILRNTFLCLAFLPLSIAFASQPEDKIARDNDTAISQSADQDDSIEKKTPKETEKSSPWLMTPIFSSDPKMATSLGGFVAYVHHFDEQSPASTFGGTGNYSSTDSYNYGMFARTYFGEDYHRLSAGAFKANIKNEYDDYLGTGLPAKTEDDINIIGLRYQYQVADNWYFGFQGVSSDYVISPGNVMSGEIISWAGLTGFKSNALGLLLNYDTRDNQNSPSAGVHFEANNLAYRESFGGDESFDAYAMSGQYYFTVNERYTTAINAKGRWTVDATTAAYSSVPLRGYVRGQYLSPHMTMIEIEERINLYKKLGMSVFTGVAVLYGDDQDFDSEDQLFPSLGAGLTYQLNDEKMIVRAEFAVGKDDNYGFYLKFGQPF